MSTTTYPIWDPELRGEAHDMWARMREHDPVHMATGPVSGNDIWFVTRHTDVEALFRHPAVGKEPQKAGLSLEDLLGDEVPSPGTTCCPRWSSRRTRAIGSITSSCSGWCSCC